MQVIYQEEIGQNHRIEIGWSTWNPDEVSIRSRYDSADGRFSNTASSEIPLTDLPHLVRIALQHLPEVLDRRATTAAG
jgi:hypothetical protein